MSNEELKKQLTEQLEEIDLKDERRVKLLNRVRAWSLGFAESVDAWRIVPRAMVVGYGVLVYQVVKWYMEIPTILSETNCKLVDGQRVCDVVGVLTPTTQHAALVTAVVGAAAVVIGLYVNSGRDWHKPLLKWFDKKE